MQMKQAEANQAEAVVFLSRSAFVALVNRLTGGVAADAGAPQHPGPWDPVIRRAMERISAMGTQPEPWRIAVSALDRLNWVAPGNAPLPTRVPLVMALAQEMIERTSLLHDLADAFPEEGRAYVLKAAGSRLVHFVDDCSHGGIPPGWPFSWPPQGSSLVGSIDAVELVVMGAQFERAAARTENEQLKHDFTEAGARLIEAGLSRM